MVTGSLNHPKMGRIIPKAVITSPDQTVVYAKMSYKQLQSSSSYSITSKKVKAALAGNTPQADPSMTPMWNLKNSGRHYTGTFIELKGDETLVLKMKESGKNSNIAMSQLSSGSQAYAKMLEKIRSGATDDAEKSTNSEHTVETWESSKGGKTIRATFISLEDGKITLKKESNKTISFAIDLLSEKSQKRAQELDTQ